MKRSLLIAPLIILIVAGLLLGGSLRFGTAQSTTSLGSPAGAPAISTVSPITATLLQTITIQGSGFGGIQPELLNLSDGSVDTVGGGNTPTIFILDENAGSGWQAGIQKNSTWGWDSIGIILESWSDTKIVLGGFGTALNTNGNGAWVISPRDPIIIDVQTLNGGVNYTTTVISSQPTQTPAPIAPGSAPAISSVSSIAAVQLQTIVINGSGFGNFQPQLMSLGDGSVDTVGGSKTPVIRIYDLGNSDSDSWEAGVQDSPNSGADSIGIILTSWSDTEIVLGGFGTALGTNNQGQWVISPGDQLLIAVLTANGQATCTTTVGSNSPPIGIGETTTISWVSPIAATRLQTIAIDGNGFGNIQPQLTNLSDGSVDTVVGGTTPVLRIYDEAGFDSWEAGCQDSQWVPKDMIGIYLVSWADNQIILGGLGSGLNVDGQGPGNINPGDPLIVDVLTSNGQAAYTVTAVSNQSNIDMNPPTPKLTVFCQSSTTISNFRVQINGNLTDNSVGISGAPVTLYYSINQGSSWQGLTMVDTDSNGNFLAEWLPSATGNYMINATYAGDSTCPGTSTVVNLVVTPFASENAQDVFSVSSNSTLSDLTFNSTSGQLSFTVSGPSGTAGYANVYISKSLVNDTSTIEAYVDGNAMKYTVSSTADSWVLHFSYHHSTHEITIDLNRGATTKLTLTQLLQGVAYGAIISLSVIVVLLLILRKDRTSHQTQRARSACKTYS